MRIIFFFLLPLLSSCAKDGKNIYVEGRVVNPVTGEGIPNIKMELWKITATGSSSGIDGKIVKEVKTDDQGNFVLDQNGTEIYSGSFTTTAGICLDIQLN